MKNAAQLITVIGPTAIGKTALGISLAQAFQSDIISCDSRQFYKEMCIGTAVPSTDELTAAKHHFIQHLSVADSYSVGDFEKDALAKLDALFPQNPIQIMVGGSGLYVDAVLKGFDAFPEIKPEIRELVRASFQREGLPYLQNTLAKHDPEYHRFLLENNPQTLSNPQRLCRFVEVCLSSGLPYSHFTGQKKNERPFNAILIGLEAPRELMYERINLRVDLMMQAGLLDEVRNLLAFEKNNALQTVGYKELFAYLKGKCTLDEAVENIKMNTRRFAKRQLTWFKRTSGVQWFDYRTPHEEIVAYCSRLIEKS